jgi:hypothetical protein
MIDVSKINSTIDCTQKPLFYYGSASYLISKTDVSFAKEYSRHPEIQAFDETEFSKMIRETCVDLFIRKIPFQQTSQYKEAYNRLRSDSNNSNIKNFKDLDDEFLGYTETFDSIKSYGYLTQKRRILPRDLAIPVDEILIIIGSLGNPIFYSRCGNHRLRIAQILGVKKVPVIIFGVSELWNEHCYKNDLSILSKI